MSNSLGSQISKNQIFRYRIPCRETDLEWSAKLELDESYSLPSFGEFDGQKSFADLRIGWTPGGILLTCQIKGKKKSVWCRTTQLLESDGLQLWFDTRNTHNVHRATKFCHWFVFMPTGGGDSKLEPVASMLKINRSKDDSPTLNRQPLPIKAEMTADGYLLRAFIPATSLNGWNSDEHRSLGFSFAVVDRELGWQTLAMGPELPILEDPSLWQTLELAAGG